MRTALLIAILLFVAGCADDPEPSGNSGPVDIAEDAGTDTADPEPVEDMGQDTRPDPEPDMDREEPDAGEPDSGEPDAGEPDAGPFNPFLICAADCNDQNPDYANKLDCDHDGLTNSEEAMLGSDSCENDSDGDGMGDLQELQNGTNPADPDSDADGLNDFDELEFKFDPTNPDTLSDQTLDGDRWIVNVCRETNVAQLGPTQVEENEAAFGRWRVALPPQYAFHELSSSAQGADVSAGVFNGTASEVAAFAYTYDGTNLNSAPDLEIAKVKFPSGSTILRQSVEGVFQTWDREEAVRGRWQIRTNRAVSTRQVRDAILEETAPQTWSGFPVSSGATYTEFQVNVTAVHRVATDMDQYVILAAVAPLDAFDTREKVQFRMDDLTNTTGFARAADIRNSKCEPQNLSGVRPKVDFYWILDDSGSMEDFFNTMVATAQDFFDRLQTTNLDYRIGVTSTGPAIDGRIRPIPGWHTDKASFTGEIFDYVCPGGSCIGGSEYGLENAMLGIQYMSSSTTPQAVRIRSDAQVIAIVMTDEDAQSVKNVGGFASPAGQALIAQYITFFTGVGVPLFAIYNDGTCPGIGDNGESYRQVANATGGASSLVCGNDLTATIEDIITAAAGRVGVVRLPTTPISASLNIMKNGEFVPRSRVNGWDYFPGSDSIAFFGDARPRVTQPGERGDDVAIGYSTWEDRGK